MGNAIRKWMDGEDSEEVFQITVIQMHAVQFFPKKIYFIQRKIPIVFIEILRNMHTMMPHSV